MKTHPDILGGSHRNPYQLENAIKSGGTVFFLLISLGLNSLPGNCVHSKYLYIIYFNCTDVLSKVGVFFF